MKRHRICVCGGGSLAHALVGVLGANEAVEVRLLTRQPQRWQQTVQVVYRREAQLLGHLDRVSSDPADVIPGADAVFLAVPSCARPEVLHKVGSYVAESTWVGAFPGFGGFDWVAQEILDKQVLLFGSQRVPYVCQTVSYGASVEVTGVRPQLFLGALPGARVNQIASLVQRTLQLPVVPMGNYLCVSLSPSNPVFHPARLYGLFKDWQPNVTYERRPLFYEEWDETATAIFAACDAELQQLCRAIPTDLSYVKPILQHYEVAKTADLTTKIQNITALKGRYAPMTQTADGWIPDIGSSFFIEDIPYGLVVIKGIAEVAGIETPVIDEIIAWAQMIMGKVYLIDNHLAGPDTKGLPIPQHFGIHSTTELVDRAS